MTVVRIVSSARCAERGTFWPGDWIFKPGALVTVDGRAGIVARQDEDDVWVSYPEFVPGTRTALAYSLPALVHIDNVKRRKR